MSLEEIQQIYDYSKSKGEICKIKNLNYNIYLAYSRNAAA